MKFNLLASASSLAMGSVVAFGLPEPAQATLTCSALSCSETVTGQTTPTDFSNLPVILDEFKPGANQQLQSVVISESSSFNASGSLTNKSGSTQTFKFQAGLGLTLQGGTGAPPSFPLLFASGSINPRTYTLAAGASTPYNFTNMFTSSSTTLTGANLAGFMGSGTFQAMFSANATTSFTGGGNNIQTNLTTVATPSVSLTYNYTVNAPNPSPTPTPEPASTAVLGAGLAGLGVIRRRRGV